MLSAPLVVWGTYDVSKPNVRQLLAGIRASGIAVHEVPADIWAGVRDKGTLEQGLLPQFRQRAEYRHLTLAVSHQRARPFA